MITKEKLKVYSKYQGDGDHYARVNWNKTKFIMESGDFSTIDGLLQDIEITERGLTTQNYLKKLNEKLLEICDGDETIAELKRMAKAQKSSIKRQPCSIGNWVSVFTKNLPNQH